MRYWSLLLILCLGMMVRAQEADDARVEAILAQMALPDKIGQLLMVNLPDYGSVQAVRDYIAEFRPGAVGLFNHNVRWREAPAIAEQINTLQQASRDASGVPLFVAVDHEGGEVLRLTLDVTPLPHPLGLGAITDMAMLRRFGTAIGGELSALGFNMNLAPVADLHTRDDAFNTYRVMNQRTWGDDPFRVGAQTAAYSAGMADARVMAVVKHFPGHGGADDSHAVAARVAMDAEIARATALRAFQIAIKDGADAIMVGHLYYSNLEPVDDLPATLSPTMMAILRDEFDFEGLIMTDALEMAAISDYFEISDAAVRVIQAGGDMLVSGPNMTIDSQRDIVRGLLAAVEKGDIAEARIDASVRRILRYKAQYGVLDWQPNPPETALDRIVAAEGEATLIDAYTHAATVVRDDAELFPIAEDASVAIVYPATHWTQVEEACTPLAPETTFVRYTLVPPAWQGGQVAQLGRDHDVVVVFLEDALRNPAQFNLLAAAIPEKTIVVSLNNPYDLERLDASISTLVAMYNSLAASHIAACQVLFGAAPARGQLPIVLNGFEAG